MKKSVQKFFSFLMALIMLFEAAPVSALEGSTESASQQVKNSLPELLHVLTEEEYSVTRIDEPSYYVGLIDQTGQTNDAQQAVGWAAWAVALAGNATIAGQYRVTVPVGVDMLADADKELTPVLDSAGFELFRVQNGSQTAERIDGFDVNHENGRINSFTFDTDIFGVYVLKYAAAFHYNGRNCCGGEGSSQILLSNLIEQLNIMNGDALLNVADVASVAFTEEHPVTVSQVSGLICYNNVTGHNAGDKDFLLTSDTPFTSEEQLTITLTNGEMIEVGMPAAETEDTGNEGTDGSGTDSNEQEGEIPQYEAEYALQPYQTEIKIAEQLYPLINVTNAAETLLYWNRNGDASYPSVEIYNSNDQKLYDRENGPAEGCVFDVEITPEDAVITGVYTIAPGDYITVYVFDGISNADAWYTFTVRQDQNAPLPVNAGEKVVTENVGSFIASETVPAGTELTVNAAAASDEQKNALNNFLNPPLRSAKAFRKGGNLMSTNQAKGAENAAPAVETQKSDPLFYEISLVGPNGEKVQAGASVTISTDIEINVPDGMKMKEDSVSVRVFHFDEDNNVTELQGATPVLTGSSISSVSFATTGFSLFAVMYTVDFVYIEKKTEISIDLGNFQANSNELGQLLHKNSKGLEELAVSDILDFAQDYLQDENVCGEVYTVSLQNGTALSDFDQNFFANSAVSIEGKGIEYGSGKITLLESFDEAKITFASEAGTLELTLENYTAPEKPVIPETEEGFAYRFYGVGEAANIADILQANEIVSSYYNNVSVSDEKLVTVKDDALAVADYFDEVILTVSLSDGTEVEITLSNPAPVKAGETVTTEGVGFFVATEEVPAGTELVVESNPKIPDGIVIPGGGKKRGGPVESEPVFFDISLVGPDGKEIQTGANVTITTDIALPEAPEGQKIANITVTVYHIDADNNVEPLEATWKQQDGIISAVSFTTPGFSLFAIVYTIEYIEINYNGVINLNFSDYEPYPAEGVDTAFIYDTDTCNIQVSVEAVLAAALNAEASGDGVASENAQVENFEIDLTNLSVTSAEGGVEYIAGEDGAAGTLVITADGSIELTDGEKTLTVNITGITKLSEEILRAEGVEIQVKEGKLPLGSEAQYTAHTDEKTAELVETYGLGEGEENIAGFSAADIKIVRNDEEVSAEGLFEVTLNKASLIPEGMKLDKLYHIHDGEVEELKDVEQTETGLVFEVSGFSDIVASYTVDFAYYDVDGLLHTWRFPGIGSRKIMDVLTALDIEAEDIIAVNLDLIDVVGEKDGTEALYLGRDDDGNITINSDMAFDDVYLLTVIADSIRYEITVTDSPPWTGTINLYDYDGTTLLTNDNAGITALSGKHYGIVAVVKNNGTVVAYNKAYIDDIATKQAFSIDLDDCKALTYNGSWWGEGETYSYNPGNGDTVEFRLYEASDSFRDKPYGNILQCADSMTGFEFLDPNGNVKDETNKTVTLNLKRAYDKQYNVRLNIQPAGLTISADDQYYAFITVDHQTTGTTYAYSQITVSSGQTVVDLPITDWYDSNGTLLPNEKFTGNETVTVQIYTTNMNSYGTKEGFSDINGIKNSQTKVLVTEGTSINRYNLYYGNRTTQSDDTNHITNYYDNLILRAPNGTISKGYIDSLLDDATDFGYYTEKYIGHSGDIEATIGAAYMNTIFEADFGYSSANVNVNRLKVLKIYTTNEGAPVSGKEVTIRLKKGETVVDQKTGTTDTNGRLEFEFDGLASGDYDIEEIINGEVVHGNGNAQIEGETVYYNFSIDKAHFVNNVNVNYFGTLGDQDTDRLIGMLQKASRVDVVILVDDETEKAKIEAALQQGAGTYGSQNIEVYVKGTNGYKSYDIVNDMVRLRQLSDDLASAQSSNTVRIVNVKASEIPEDGMAFDDDGRYIVLNIEMDQQAFCPRVLLDGQLLDADYGQSGKSNSSRVLYNLRSNGSCYGGLFDTTKVGAGIILAPSANAHILGGPFGGTIITYQVNRQGNELHSNNPNQIQTLNATIHNVIGGAPTTGSLELRKLFANSAIKDKITYFTFEVTLTNADLTKVANQTFPASGLKQGNTVTFDAEGKALVLVRAGNSVTIADLPDGTTYTVTEVTTPETEHFIFDSIHTTEDNGTIVAGKTQSAKIYNNLKTADLTIVKEVTGTTDDSKLFEFTLELENNTAAANETAVWQPYPDAYTISIVGGETISVPAGQGGSQTIKLKAGQRAEITGLKDNDKVLRYTVTEVAVWINGVRNAISTQPFYGYSTDDLVQEGTYTESGTIVSFVNNYKAETKVKLVAKKVLQGRELAANEFTFELRANSPIGPVIGEQKTNAADGTVTFDDIEYKIDYTTNPIVNSMAGAIQKEDSTRENTFTYYICEVNTNDTSVAYADPIQVKVKVVDDGLGNLRAYDEEGNLITEYNNEGTLTNYTYTLPESKDVVNNVMIEKTLEGTKTMTGRDMEEGEVFEFIVKENNVEVARGTATGGTNGTPVAITFPPMVYAYDPDATYPVTHIYTITEDNTKLFDDVQANSQVFYAKVEVTYNSSTHEMTATGPEYSSSADGPWSGTSNIAFENTGETIGFSVTKDWKDQEDQAVLNVASVTLRISRKDGKPFVLKASQWINSNGKGTVTNVTRTAASLTEYELYMIAHGNMEDPTKQNLLKLEPDGTGWPVVQFTNLPETTYVVEEVECKLNNENAAVETVYALNSSADVAAAPDITADGDSLVVKNTETSNNLKVTKNFVLPNGNSANDIASKDSIYFAVRLHHSEDGSWWTYYNNGSATTMVNSVPLYEITWDATNQKWNTVTIGPIPETYAVSNDYNAPVLSYSVVEMTAEGAEKTTDAHLLGIKYIKNYGRTNEEVTRIEQGQGATITIENEIPEPRHLTVTKQWLDTYGELISGTPGQDKNITFKLKAKSAYGLVDVNSLDENNAIQKKLKELLNATYTLTGTCGADGHFTWTTQSFDDLPSTYDGTNWVKYFVEEISPSGMMVSYILEDGSVVNADHPHDPAQSGNITMTNKPEDSEGKIKVRKVWDGVSESDKKPVQVKIYRKSLTESSGAPVSKIGVTVNVGYGYNNYCQGPENSTIDSGYLTPGAIAEITSNYPVVGVYRSDNGIPLTVTNNQFEVPNDDVIIVISNWKTDGVTVEVNETVENPDQVWATINLSGNTTPAWEGTAAVPVKNGYVYYAQEVDAEGFDVSYSYTDSTGVSHSGETSMTSGIVNGVITVTNTRTETPKGSVKVTKVFDGLTSDQFPAGFQITNVINDTVFGLNTTGGKVAPTGGSGTTADPYYWQIDDLDVGTVVTFTETGLDVTGYDVSVIANSVASESPFTATATAAQTTPGVASFVNTYTPQPGSLTITKVIAPVGADASGTTFTFEVTFTNADDIAYVGYVTVQDAARTTPTSATTDSNGKLTVTITGAGNANITNIPAGTSYTVAETTIPTGWEQTGNVAITGGDADQVIDPGETETATVTNIKKGSLKITKAVTVNGAETATNLADGEYTFTVTGPGSSTDTVATVVIKVENGVAAKYKLNGADSFTDLQANNRFVVIENLTPGVYTVTEASVSNGTTLASVTGDGTETVDRGVKLTVAAGDTAELNVATFTNNIETGDLQLTKIVSGKTDTTTEFEFQITLTPPTNVTLANSYSGTIAGVNTTFTVGSGGVVEVDNKNVKLKHGETMVINDLPAGTQYTIQEINVSKGFAPTWTNGSGSIPANNPAGTKATASVSVENVFTAEGAPFFNVKKTFTNGDLSKKQFTFKLSQVAGDNLTTAPASADVRISDPVTVSTDLVAGTEQTKSFTLPDTFKFTQVDIGKTFWFMIEETVPEAAQTSPFIAEHVKYANPSHKWVSVTVSESDGDLVFTKNTAAGQPDAAFVNEQLGTLVVTKTFAGNAAADLTDAQKEAITFSITGPSGFTAITNRALRDSSFVKDNGVYTLTLDNIPLGEYTITEANTAIGNYKLTSAITVDEASSTNGTATLSAADTEKIVAFTNTYDKYQLEVTKSFEGATLTNEQKANIKLTVSGSDLTGTLTHTYAEILGMTDSKWILTTSDNNIQPGVAYTVTETDASVNGYTLTTTYKVNGGTAGDTNTVTLEATQYTGASVEVVNHYRNAELIITKTISGVQAGDLNNALAGISFTVTDVTEGENITLTQTISNITMSASDLDSTSGKYIKTLTSAADGIIPDHKYQIVETATAPNGYVLMSTTYTVVAGTADASNNANSTTGKLTLTDANTSSGEIDFTNTYGLTKLTISKMMSAGPSTQTFSFTVEVKDAENHAYTGTAYIAGENEGYTTIQFSEAGQYTASIAAGSSLTIYGLPDGYSYTVTEAAVDGFKLVSVDGDTTKTTSTGRIASTESTAAFVNEELVDIEATKTWYQTGDSTTNINSTLTNAQVTFTLQKRVGNGEWTAVATANNPATMQVTAADAEVWKASWTDLPKYEGENLIAYKVVESNPMVNNTSIALPETSQVEVASNAYTAVQGHNPKATVNIDNTLPNTSITVTKEWDDGTKTGEEVNAWPTGIASVQVGLTRIVEETASKYPSAEAQTTASITSEDNQSVTFSNLPVYDNTGALITYGIEELSVTPTGEEAAAVPVSNAVVTVTGVNSWSVSVSDVTNNVATVTNTTVQTSITIVKVDGSDTSSALSGAVFELKKEAGIVEGAMTYTVINSSIAVAADGSATLTALTDGTYLLTETQAPAGYNLLSGPISFTVSNGVVTFADGSSSVVEYVNSTDRYLIKNTPGVELPSTGGTGTLPYTLTGLTLLLGASLILYYRRRREQN